MTDEQHCVSFTIPTGNWDNFPIGIPIRWYVVLQNLNSQSDVLSRRVYLLIKLCMCICELFIVIVQTEQNAATHFVNQVLDKY
jgi:hypothetical protein